MLRKTKFAPGEYYHIYSRGVERRKIFLDNNDHLRFLLLLYLMNTSERIHLSKIFRDIFTPHQLRRPRQGDSLTEVKMKHPIEIFETIKIKDKDNLVSIVSYCLMPNHFHLLIKEKQEGGITRFMRRLMTAYSMYFNKKNNRSGPLFVRPFRAKHADSDNYLTYLVAYIHLNPIKLIDTKWKEKGITDLRKAKKFLDNYSWSSYLDYIDSERPERRILTKKELTGYFIDSEKGEEFEEFIDDWLDFRDDEEITLL